ncbi:hypothetical protein [Roseiflexus sp.]|uniref:hypothetical protein n=1 Tax=Roseiflexus sp. TaxID=2562120 RepID=UPI0021DBFBB4|nr:hypothetical protein [Roseiflexus sp.]GIV98635.1 MAG: hypothetical protein KatS3mg058_0039 [Roseiflexus sp.]
MSNSTQRNLDRLAAKHGQEIIRRVVDEEETQKNKREDEKKSKQQLTTSIENTITKALGVLQENGVYACFLYLLAREKENGSVVVDEMLNVLNGLGFGWGKPASNSPEAVLAHVSDKVTADLEHLLLAKETLEQMLIYARYGAKARE